MPKNHDDKLTDISTRPTRRDQDLSHLEISTSRLQIRAVGRQDLGLLASLFQDPEVQRHFVIEGMTAEGELAWALMELRAGTGGYFRIDIKGDPPHSAGVIVFWRVDPSEIGRRDDKFFARFGLALHSSLRGRGFGTEATEAILTFLTSTLGVDHCVARCNTDNVASHAVLKKTGFSQVLVTDDSNRLFFVRPAFPE